MHVICCDLEGVFVPEIWINVAEKTGIEELRLTTRDISDYNVLMRKRLAILEKHNLKLQDIQAVIATMEPLENALAFLDWMRAVSQVIIVSDTFVQFADPLMQKLKRPTLFCNTLKVASDGQVVDYLLRQSDGKRKVVEGLQSMNFKVAAMGDSYNDITMLKKADCGFLFRPPANVVSEFPNFPVTSNYTELKPLVAKALKDFEA